MINIFAQYKEIFCQIINQIAVDKKIENYFESLSKISVEPSKDNNHGDLATNTAMVMIKNFSNTDVNNPRKLAEEIILKFKETAFYQSDVEKIEIAGAGFINIFLKKIVWQNIVFDLVNCLEISYPNLGKNQKVNLEYASPNPTGPLHIGHTRGAIYGDVLANLLIKVGFDVVKEYYINDAGSQIITLVKSAFLRYYEIVNNVEVEIAEGFYPGDYLIDLAKKIFHNYGDKFSQVFEISVKQNEAKKTEISFENQVLEEKQIYQEFRQMVLSSMIEMIKQDLFALGIKHNSYFSEKENLHDTNKINEIIDFLKTKNKDGQSIIYQGFLSAPKTEKGVGVDFESYDECEQTLFRSTLFGDDQDRVVEKIDRSEKKSEKKSDRKNSSLTKIPTYFAADLAYIKSKFDRGANLFIIPLGFDHAGYVKRMKAAVEVITENKAKIEIILCQMVKFVKDGKPLKMSKRAGNFILAREVINEVGADAIRFMMLTRKNDAPFDFDLAKVVEMSKDNPIFYVQYASARCYSVMKQARQFIDVENLAIDKQQMKLLDNPIEIELMKKIAQFPRIIETAAINFEPHRLSFFIQELSSIFHSLWNYGSENVEAKFINEKNIQLSEARIYLVKATQKIISEILSILSIKPVNEM